MKRLGLLFVICGALAFSSCTKHACPAYGKVQKAATANTERA